LFDDDIQLKVTRRSTQGHTINTQSLVWCWHSTKGHWKVKVTGRSTKPSAHQQQAESSTMLTFIYYRVDNL